MPLSARSAAGGDAAGSIGRSLTSYGFGRRAPLNYLVVAVLLTGCGAPKSRVEIPRKPALVCHEGRENTMELTDPADRGSGEYTFMDYGEESRIVRTLTAPPMSVAWFREFYVPELLIGTEGALLVVDDDSTISRIDPSDGSLIWQSILAEDQMSSGGVEWGILPGQIWLYAEYTYRVVVDLKDGRVSPVSTTPKFDPPDASIASSDDSIDIRISADELQHEGWLAGKRIWWTDHPPGMEALNSWCRLSSSRVAFVDSGGFLVALEIGPTP